MSHTMLIRTLLTLAFTFLASPLFSEQIHVEQYFPLTDGAWWSYSEMGDSLSRWVVPGSFSINGRSTKALQHSNGYKTYFSNDDKGVLLHREVDPNFYIYGYGTTKATLTFKPPLVYASPVMTLGSTVHSSGKVEVSLTGLGSATLNYSATSILEDEDVESVPFGNFKCLQGRNSLHVSGSFKGEWISESRTEKIWVTKGLGVIKYDDYDIGKLTGTNLQKPTEYVELSGSVKTSEGDLLCALILANGEHMFSCGSNMGKYELLAPLDSNGQVTLFGFCSGRLPVKQTFTPGSPSAVKNLSLTSGDSSASMDVTIVPVLLNNGDVRLTGQVTVDGSPANVMVLANGQYVFTNGKTLPLGQYQLEVPLDAFGKITLYAFCSGLPPYKEQFQPFALAWR